MTAFHHSRRTGSAFEVLACIGVLGALAVGCSDGEDLSAPTASEGPAPVIEGPAPQPRAPDGLLNDRSLQDIVELQLRRDGSALLDHLESESAAVRARAALALGSVQFPGASADLEALLDDPEEQVRLDAAFALGQLPSSNGGAALLQALAGETDSRVRIRLIDALGKVGDARSIEGLLETAADPAAAAGLDRTDEVLALEEAALGRAIGRALLRGVEVPGAVRTLALRLEHEDPAVREAAAWFFGRAPEVSSWVEQVDRVRSALDESESSDPAVMHLLLALARNGDADDTERLLHWLEHGDDWRGRTSAAMGLGDLSWIEQDGVREALFRALDDPIEHVAVAAARSLTRGLWVPPDVLVRMESRLADDPGDRWRLHVPFLGQISRFGNAQAVVNWTGRAMDVHPLAVANGLAALAEAGVPEADSLLLQAIGHPDPDFSTVGVSALAGSWEAMVVRGMPEEEIQELLLDALREGPAPAAAYAGPILAQPAFARLGASEDALHAAARRWLDQRELHVSGVLARSLSDLGDPRADELISAIDAATADLAPDWEYLAELGPTPRLRIETNRGDIVVRLSVEQAPLSVQGLAQLAEAGRHDGIPFHRVEPNFVVQGGDVAMSDGSGSPGIRLPSEFTTIPFRRGTLGMASLGKDTEGSQFFLTHSMQPHLDGAFTSFGWVESGFDVLDRLGVGDRVVRMRVNP